MLDFADPADAVLARELAHRADIVIENFRPGGLARFGLDYETVAAANPKIIYASISGFGTTEKGAALPGYDLIVQAISGLMSLTGDPDGPPYRAGISVFDVMAGLHATIGVLAALHKRHETGRGQHVEVNLLSSALSGLVNHSSAYVAGGVGAVPDGQQPPEPVPVRAAALRRRRPDHHRRQRRPVPQAVRGARTCPSWPTTRASPTTRTGRPTGTSSGRCWWSGWQTRTKQEWFRDIIAAGVPCGPINTIDAGVAFAEEIGLDPVVEVGPPGSAVPSVRNPITLSETPGRLPLSAARTGRARRRDPGLAGRHLQTDDRATQLQFPTSLGTSDADHIRLLGLDLADDLMGKVGFGELAFWLVALRRPTPAEVRVFEAVLVALADHGFTPTAIAARLTYLSAPDSLQGALAAGLLGGGSRFLGVTEDCGEYLHEALAGQRRRSPDRRRRLGRARAGDRARDQSGGPLRARARSSGAQGRGPAYAGVDQDRDRGGTARSAPAAVRGDRPGP